MLREHNLNQHRRNKSELMNYATIQPTKTKKKVTSAGNNPKKRPAGGNKKGLSSNTVNNLLNKSTKRASRKQILVEDIDQVGEEEGDDFFCFGKGYCNKLRPLEPEMEEIAEVPDTGSYSQRNTDQDHRTSSNKESRGRDSANKENRGRDSANKENRGRDNRQHPNDEDNDKSFRLSKNQERTSATDNATIALHSHRVNNNCSRRSSNNSQRSECSQTHSTVELSRQRSKLSRSKSRGKNENSELRALREKTARMEKNMKMIWECMGEIWENSRTCKQATERAASHLHDLSHRVTHNEKALLDLKLDLGRKGRDTSFRA